jgi:hypothetical protein
MTAFLSNTCQCSNFLYGEATIQSGSHVGKLPGSVMNGDCA